MRLGFNYLCEGVGGRMKVLHHIHTHTHKHELASTWGLTGICCFGSFCPSPCKTLVSVFNTSQWSPGSILAPHLGPSSFPGVSLQPSPCLHSRSLETCALLKQITQFFSYFLSMPFRQTQYLTDLINTRLISHNAWGARQSGLEMLETE